MMHVISHKKLSSLIAKDRVQEIIKECNDLHPTDLALLFYNLSFKNQKKLFFILQDHLNPEIIPWLDLNLLEILLNCIGFAKFAHMLSDLDIVKIIKIMVIFPSNVMENIIIELHDDIREAVKKRFKYPEKTLGRIMSTDYVEIPSWWTVKDMKYFLSLNTSAKKSYAVIIIDANHRPIGTIYSIKAIGCKVSTKVEDIMDDIEIFDESALITEVILSFKKYELNQACVINHQKKLIGHINFTQILNALEEETESDSMQLHGIFYDSSNQNVHLDDNLINNIKSRIPWIFINLLVAFIVSNIIINFENIISHYIYAASLMSIVASAAGSSGAQTVAVTVRLMSKTQVRAISSYAIMISEILIGLTNGIIISLISFGMSLYMYNDIKISIIFGIAILANFTIAGIIGSVTPVLLEKIKLDPASGSNVISTAVTDIFGFFIFLYMINWMHEFIK